MFLIFVLLSSAASAGELRLRAAALFGPTTYSSESQATLLKTEIKGNQPGVATSADLWLTRALGARFTANLYTVNVSSGNAPKGKFINQALSELDLAWRPLGKGDSKTGELAFFSGPAVSYYSVVRAYPNSSQMDLVRVNVMNLAVGTRMRFPVSQNCMVELQGAYLAPYSALNYGRSALDTQATYGYSGSIGFDVRVWSGFDFSFGFRHETHQLEIKLPDAGRSEKVFFKTNAPFLAAHLSI